MLLELAKMGVSIAKKKKARRLQKAQLNAQRKDLLANRAAMQETHKGEQRKLSSSFANRGVAGSPAAAEGVQTQRTQQGREVAGVNRDIAQVKKVKRAGKLDITKFL